MSRNFSGIDQFQEFKMILPFKIDSWETDGCYRVEPAGDQDAADKVVCRCNHLTNFAVLLDITQTFYNPIGLQYVTKIGGWISFASLVATILVYAFLR